MSCSAPSRESSSGAAFSCSSPLPAPRSAGGDGYDMGPSASESSSRRPEERAHSPVAARSRRTILVVSNHGDIVGGGEVSLLVLLKGLDRTRWSPVVVVPSEGGMATRCRELGLPTHVIPLPGLRRPWLAIFRSMATLRRLARDTGASLLH